MKRAMAQEYASDALQGIKIRVAVRKHTLDVLKEHAVGKVLNLTTSQFLDDETIVLNLEAATVFGLLTIAQSGEDHTIDDLIERLAKETS